MKKVFGFIYKIVRFIFSIISPISHLAVFFIFYFCMYHWVFIISLFQQSGTRKLYRRKVTNRIKYRLVIFAETFIDIVAFVFTLQILFVFPLLIIFGTDHINDIEFEIPDYIIISVLLIIFHTSFILRYRYLFRLNKHLQEIDLTLVHYWSKKKITIDT